jgi:hypothetical protein
MQRYFGGFALLYTFCRRLNTNRRNIVPACN